MPRPRKRRRIRKRPRRLWFKPRGVPLSSIGQRDLSVDELEAMRLKHIEKMSQEEAANQMEVSRSTYARILKKAHEKITKFLVRGEALQIKEPEYVSMPREFQCGECGHTWNQPYGTGRPRECPECESIDIKPKFKESRSHRDKTGKRQKGGE